MPRSTADAELNHALLIGNSDGIGLGVTKRLLAHRWSVTGISRSDSPIQSSSHQHHVLDITDPDYPRLLTSLTEQQVPDLCIYFAGIGELLDIATMAFEEKTFEVNLTGMVKTAAVVIPKMVSRGSGHFIGLSSVADELASSEAPAYHATKAGFSSYLKSLAMAAKPKGVAITNVRFGFVDTKMAKGDRKPFMIPVEKAVDHMMICINKRPRRCTAPRFVIPFLKLHRLVTWLKYGC